MKTCTASGTAGNVSRFGDLLSRSSSHLLILDHFRHSVISFGIMIPPPIFSAPPWSMKWLSQDLATMYRRDVVSLPEQKCLFKQPPWATCFGASPPPEWKCTSTLGSISQWLFGCKHVHSVCFILQILTVGTSRSVIFNPKGRDFGQRLNTSLLTGAI